MDFYKSAIPILDDSPAVRDILHPKGVGFGYVERDYDEYPEEMFALPDEMELVPESEYDARFDYQEETKSSLEHLYLGPDGKTPAFENLDQDGHGYCWTYSTGHCIMLDRLKKGQPLKRLNPHATAAIIKKGKDEGGWSGLSAQFAREHGYATEGTGPGEWPLHSRNLKYDTPELRANMARFKVTEDWVDTRKRVYDQNLTQAQLFTCGFNNCPSGFDNNDWGHAICFLRMVRIEPGSWGPLILNSWKNWGRFGLAVLRGKRAICAGGVAIRSTTIS